MIKTLENDLLREAIEKSKDSRADNIQPAFLKIYKGPARIETEPVRPVALCNLTGQVKSAAWWSNFGVDVGINIEASAFAYAGGDIWAVFDRGLLFLPYAMRAQSMGFALELIAASNYLRYDFSSWGEQTRTRKAKRFLADIRNLGKLPPVERLFLPWGAVIVRT